MDNEYQFIEYRKDEERFYRREIINYCIQKCLFSRCPIILSSVKNFVRWYEKKNYGKELKAYK